MLRAWSARPLVARQFSSKTSIWNNSQRQPSPSIESAESANQSTPTTNPSSSGSSQPPLDEALERHSSSLPQYDLEIVRRRLREWTGQKAVLFRTHADEFTAKSKTTFFQLGSHLNKVTGYEAIEALKRDVAEQEARITATRQAAREAKKAYDEAVARRSNSQRKVNDLLQRKSLWTESDLGQFTTIVRQDHLFEQEEARAKAAVHDMDNTVEREFSQLLHSIFARYHEEQVWSDKIRSASTYGSLAALGLNMLVFLMAIIVVEPWKRQRLAQTFGKKVEELSRENGVRLDASMKEIGAQLADQERLILHLRDVSQNLVSGHEAPLAKDSSQQPEDVPAVAAVADELYTERTINKFRTMHGTLELVVVATGAFLTGVVGCLWLGR